MNTWIADCIKAYEAMATPSLEGFAEHLRGRLTNEMTGNEKSNFSLFQIAGYARNADGAHPEMFFVRNIDHIDQNTGNYVGAKDDFDISEDFWNRDYLDDDVKATIAAGGHQRYFNGSPPGRIAFVGVSQMLDQFFQQAWGNTAWQFRSPQTLEELGSFVELQIRAVGALYGSSNYPAPYIGGDIQMERIPPPPDAVSL